MSKYQCKSCGGFCGKSRCERLPIPIEHIRFPYLDAKQKLIRIMGTFDLATGHANTFDELLDSLQAELRDVLGHYREALKTNKQTNSCSPQTKPLSDEEINEIKTLMEINYGCVPPLEFAWAIEERHGIK